MLWFSPRWNPKNRRSRIGYWETHSSVGTVSVRITSMVESWMEIPE